MVIFIAWIVFNPLEQKKYLNCIKEIYENTNLCNIIMPSEDTKILEFNQYQKSDKPPFIIFADIYV